MFYILPRMLFTVDKAEKCPECMQRAKGLREPGCSTADVCARRLGRSCQSTRSSGHAQKKKRSRAQATDATPTASITDGSLHSAKSRRKAPTTKKYVVIGDQWVEQPETTGTRAGSSFSAAAADFQREQSAAKRRSKAAEAAMAAVAVVQPARSQSLSERKVKSGERSPSSRARRALRECTRA